MIMLVCFLPVLFCCLFIGNNMDYNASLKPDLVVPGWLVAVCAIIAAFAMIIILLYTMKKPMSKKGDLLCSFLFRVLTFGLVLVSNKIAREIAFFLPWDIDVVRGAALSLVHGQGSPDQTYFSIYTNNIPIVYILAKILEFSNAHGYSLHEEFIWVQVNCVLMSLAVFFQAMIIKRLTGNLFATLTAFFSGAILIGSSGWKIAAYTDTYGQLFPILCIYFYICFAQSEKQIKRYIFLALSSLSALAGGFIKPNIMLMLIAIVMTMVMEVILYPQRKPIHCVFLIIVSGILLFGFKTYQKTIPDKIGVSLVENIAAAPAEYFYMGLNEAHTGSYNGEDVTVYGEFQFEPAKERDKVVMGRAIERIRERGVVGTLYFWLRKMTMTFNDGTFGWSGEVWNNGYYYPVVSSDTPLTDFLRSIYWKGPRSAKFGTVCQCVWYFVLIGIPGCAIALFKKRNQQHIVFVISFLGVFFYQLLFEARARYLFCFLPVIICVSILGYIQYAYILKDKGIRIDGLFKADKRCKFESKLSNIELMSAKADKGCKDE